MSMPEQFLAIVPLYIPTLDTTIELLDFLDPDYCGKMFVLVSLVCLLCVQVLTFNGGTTPNLLRVYLGPYTVLKYFTRGHSWRGCDALTCSCMVEVQRIRATTSRK